MDDLILLKWFALLIMLTVAGAVTILSPFLVAAIGLVVLAVGVVRRLRTRCEGTTLMVVAGLLLLPPTVWFTLGIAH
ncbi:MAG: hypothetical protein M3083_06450 [Actinomycetota bacterium]|nr:hypothetical protein [Actinomycetota bacterium]